VRKHELSTLTDSSAVASVHYTTSLQPSLKCPRKAYPSPSAPPSAPSSVPQSSDPSSPHPSPPTHPSSVFLPLCSSSLPSPSLSPWSDSHSTRPVSRWKSLSRGVDASSSRTRPFRRGCSGRARWRWVFVGGVPRLLMESLRRIWRGGEKGLGLVVGGFVMTFRVLRTCFERCFFWLVCGH